jgi:transglutaminase-like putative cysteine protease
LQAIRASVSRVEYVPEFGRAVRIEEYDRPMLSDDEETAQTVSYMDAIAAAESNDAAVENAVSEALAAAGITADAPPLDIAAAVFRWLKSTVRYVPTPGTSPLVDQTLISPTAVLAMPDPIGDCPQFSMLAAAMFRVLCMPTRYVTIAAADEAPDQWSHIYNMVELDPGRWLPFDSSNGPAPGSEYTRPYKKKVWPQLSAGDCQSKERGAQMIRPRSRPAGMRNRVIRGALGDDGSSTDFSIDDNTIFTGSDGSVFTPSGGYDLPPLTTDINASPGMVTFPTAAASTTSPSWWQTLGTDLTKITAPLVKQQVTQANRPYYITSPTGQSVLYNPATGSVGTGASAGVTSQINPTYLLLGVGAIALLAFAGKK